MRSSLSTCYVLRVVVFFSNGGKHRTKDMHGTCLPMQLQFSFSCNVHLCIVHGAQCTCGPQINFAHFIYCHRLGNKHQYHCQRWCGVHTHLLGTWAPLWPINKTEEFPSFMCNIIIFMHVCSSPFTELLFKLRICFFCHSPTANKKRNKQLLNLFKYLRDSRRCTTTPRTM